MATSRRQRAGRAKPCPYDSNPLHEKAAGNNHQLVSPPRACNKGVRDLKHNCPQRVRALGMLDSPLEKCGLKSGSARNSTTAASGSRGYGGLTMLGLHYLPAWVGGPRRVALWSAGKILIPPVRDAKKKGLGA